MFIRDCVEDFISFSFDESDESVAIRFQVDLIYNLECSKFIIQHMISLNSIAILGKIATYTFCANLRWKSGLDKLSDRYKKKAF